MSVPVAAALAMGAGGCRASEGDDKTVTVWFLVGEALRAVAQVSAL